MSLKDVQKALIEKGYNPGPADGLWGPKTEVAIKKVIKLAPQGSQTIEVPEVVLYQSELADTFGLPRDPAPYLKVFSLEEFKDRFGPVKDFTGKPWSWRIYGHELMEKPLKDAFRNLFEADILYELKTYDGCLNIRKMTGGGGWSVHSWGLAIDLNASENRYGAKPKLSAGFVKCFKDAGFTWGGDWRTPDGMHFQLPKI